MVPLSSVPEMLKRISSAGSKWDSEMGIIAHIGDGNIHPIPIKPEGMSPERWAVYSEEFFEELIKEAISLGGVGKRRTRMGHGAAYNHTEQICSGT